MKTIFRIIIHVLSSLPLALNAQLTADAGPDKVHCFGADNLVAVHLGSNPTAVGGTEPYTYKWETSFFYQMGNFTIAQYASDFLNDTTSANPTVEWGTFNHTPLSFKLTVTDANNQISIDSTIVSFSSWLFTNDYWEFHIQQGESIYLNYGAGAYSNYPPYEYLWRPGHGISDSVHESFWATPDTSIVYNVTITDAVGCRIDEMARYHVYITPVSADFFSIGKPIQVYPVPANMQKLNFRLNHQKPQELLLYVYDLTGKLILKGNLDTDSFCIDINDLKPGIYVYRLFGDGDLIGSEKFEIQ